MLTKTVIRIVVGVCLLSSHLVQSAQPSESINFTVANHYDVGGEGGWDFISIDAHLESSPAWRDQFEGAKALL